jgi:Fe-S cluster biosynthesis and repair protein YggX
MGSRLPSGRSQVPATGRNWNFPCPCRILKYSTAEQESLMADETNSGNSGPGITAQPATQTVRTVKCVKLGREMPGLDRIPWKGEIGKKVYDNVSKEAWKLWVEHSKMVMNEFRLNPLDPKAQQVMEEQLNNYFFGDGAKLPDSYVPPKH